MYNDSISDAITRLRNAARAAKAQVSLRRSKSVERIVEILKDEGYINSFKVNSNRIDVAMNLSKPIRHLRCLSKPGNRHYVKVSQIHRPRLGLGTVIISTPKGVLTGFQATKQKVGGELVCEVW